MKWLWVIAIILSSPVVWAQDDLDDVEADMETALSESEAAESLAKEQKRMAIEEEERAVKSKKDAENAQARARVRESKAKEQIQVLERRITEAKTKTKEHLTLKAAAEAKILELDIQVKAKQETLTILTAEKQAALEERTRQEDLRTQKSNEKKKIEDQIIKDREEIGKMRFEISDLKNQILEAEKNLVLLREKAQKETLNRAQVQSEYDGQKRKLASVPKKVVVRKAVHNCAVKSDAAEGAPDIGDVKKGTKYELYRVVQKQWIEIQFGKRRAFTAKTCF
jgi:hypothetical protein